MMESRQLAPAVRRSTLLANSQTDMVSRSRGTPWGHVPAARHALRPRTWTTVELFAGGMPSIRGRSHRSVSLMSCASWGVYRLWTHSLLQPVPQSSHRSSLSASSVITTCLRWIPPISPKDLRLTIRCISEKCSGEVGRLEFVSISRIYPTDYAPVLTFPVVPSFSVHPEELQDSTKKKLNDRGYFYANSNAGLGWTDRANRYATGYHNSGVRADQHRQREAFYKWRIVPRTCVDTNTRDLTSMSPVVALFSPRLSSALSDAVWSSYSRPHLLCTYRYQQALLSKG